MAGGHWELGDALGVPHGQHICLLYSDDDVRSQTIARFFKAALQGNNKLLYITDTQAVEEVRREFAKLGVALTDPACAQLTTTPESYYPTGRFEPEAMLSALEVFAAGAIRDGFPGCRCTGEMGWAARGVPGAERLLDYETMLTDVVERQPFSGICQYDVRLFDGAAILAVMEVHPFLLVRGQVLRNPHYVRRDATARPAVAQASRHESRTL